MMQFRHHSILTRVLSVTVIALLVLTVALHYKLSEQQGDELNAHIEDNFSTLKAEMTSETAIRTHWMESVLLLLQRSIDSEAITKALESEDRQRLALLAADYFKTLQQNNQVTHMYFMDAERRVVLRMHQPERYGDIIDRVTAKQAELTGQRVAGIELGPLGTLTLRVVVPWTLGARRIGYLELGIELEDILAGIELDNSFRIVLAVDKSHLHKDVTHRVNGRWSMFKGFVLLYPEERAKQLIPVIEASLDRKDELPHVIPMGDIYYGLKHTPFLDASGREIGQLIMLLDLSTENIDLSRALYTTMALFVGFMVFFILLLYLLISRSEKARRAAESRLELYGEAFTNTIGGIMITDCKGTIIDVNAAFERVTGYSKDEAVGRNPSMLKSGLQDGQFYQRMWHAIQERGQWQGRIVNCRKNGDIYPEHLSITAICDEHGVVKNYIGVFLDASEQEQLQEQFQQAQRMESLGTLVGGIAHEFNNMLAGMTGNLYLAKSEVKEHAAAVEKLNTVESLAFQAADMIKQLLTFARKGTTRTEETNLALFLKSSKELFQLSLHEDVTLKQQISDQEITVDVDRSQLQQILMNLINNSKAALQGVNKPEISIVLDHYVADHSFLNRFPELKGSEFARITVKDNGAGIEEQCLEKIFEPFFTTREVGDGAGLGLSMVFGAIKGYGGVIEVDSCLGMGTSMHLYIPALSKTSEIMDIEAEVSTGHGETILVVDDDELVVETACKVLSRLGYEVLSAASGREAIALFEAHQYEIGVVILDVVMPELSGPETADLIQIINEDVTIIFATGYDTTDTLHKRIEHTGELVLRKPYQISVLSQILKEILNR